MKQTLGKGISCILMLVLGLGLLAGLLQYMRPMKNEIYNLSLNDWEGEGMPDDWVYDQKGWRVFTQEGEIITDLTSNGDGSFTGLAYMGQTFYLSRTMTEEVDSPTLRLETVTQNLAVFLDGDLLYTDCPELDNRIGALCLPVPEWDRTEPVVLNLPENYVGRVLTIACSSSLYGELQEATRNVWPCSITLSCGYAYESSLIAESFQTAIAGVFSFLAGMILLVVFLLQTLHGNGDWGLLCAATVAFFLLAHEMCHVSFFYSYYDILPVDPVSLCRDLSLTALLAFLSSRMAQRQRKIVCRVLTLLQAATVAIDVILQLTERLNFTWIDAERMIGLAAVLTVLFCGVLEARQGNRIFRLLCLLVAAGMGLWFVYIFVSPSRQVEIWKYIIPLEYGYFLWRLLFLTLTAALIAAVALAVRGEFVRRMEARLLTERQALSQESFEAMRQQNEQVMMLRHDMTKHYQLLRQITKEDSVAAYLDELMEQNEKIRPVVQSGNEIIDIILNTKLSAAEAAGIQTDIVRMNAPASLSLSDAELCSVVMNLLDNALAAASAPGVKTPYIQLDLYNKGSFFVFSCKNAATEERSANAQKQEKTFGHGLGLKIVRQIVQRHSGPLDVEMDVDSYKVLLALPHVSK